MGSYLSRDVDRVESISDQPSSSHTFPPASGPYFAPYYYMGGQKFETSQPESYLFGENSDLQYLGPSAQNFSYKMPATNQLVQALKCLVNIRKDSLRLIRAPNAVNKPDDVISTNQSSINDENTPPQKLYNLEFTFDADCPCSIKVFYNASEKIVNNSKVVYTSKSDKECSDLVHFNAGSNQQFCLPTHIINPANLQKVANNNASAATQGKWSFDCIPVVIQVNADAGPAFDGHCHIAYATLEQAPDEGWTIKLMKQKQMIDGVCYIIQEIYGIENKVKSKKEDEEGGNVSDGNWESDDGADNTECVVCLSDMKDTIILPCKHLCLCNSCANQIRFQQSGCPICRQSFRALLQIRAVRKITEAATTEEAGAGRSRNASGQLAGDDEASSSDENNMGISLPPLPEGYEAVPLIDAINGPATHSSLASIPLPAGNLRATSSTRSRTNSSQHRSSRRKKKSSTMIEIEDETSNAQHVLNNVSNMSESELRRSSFHQSNKKKRSKRNKTNTNQLELQTPVTDVSKSYETEADEYEVEKSGTDPEMASIETMTTRTSGDDESIEMKPTTDHSDDDEASINPQQTPDDEEENKKEQ